MLQISNTCFVSVHISMLSFVRDTKLYRLYHTHSLSYSSYSYGETSLEILSNTKYCHSAFLFLFQIDILQLHRNLIRAAKITFPHHTRIYALYLNQCLYVILTIHFMDLFQVIKLFLQVNKLNNFKMRTIIPYLCSCALQFHEGKTWSHRSYTKLGDGVFFVSKCVDLNQKHKSAHKCQHNELHFDDV